MTQARSLVVSRGEPRRASENDRDGELGAGDLQGQIRHLSSSNCRRRSMSASESFRSSTRCEIIGTRDPPVT